MQKKSKHAAEKVRSPSHSSIHAGVTIALVLVLGIGLAFTFLMMARSQSEAFRVNKIAAQETIISNFPSFNNERLSDDQQILNESWKRASYLGGFVYHSELEKTTHPTPRLENTGRQPRTTRVQIDGQFDRRLEQMFLKIKQANYAPLAVKIENGLAFGRQGESAEWKVLDFESDVFSRGI